MSTGPTFPLSIHLLVTSLVSVAIIIWCFFLSMWFIILGIAYIILLMINFFGNGSVIYIFLKVKALRTPSNMFVVNLALSDWCMMLTQVWQIKRKGLNHRFLFFRLPQSSSMYSLKDIGCGALWVWEMLTNLFEIIIPFIIIQGCKLYGFAGALFGTASIMTMIIIGYDRYNVIVKVHSHLSLYLSLNWLNL